MYIHVDGLINNNSLLMAIWNNSSISMAEKAALTAQAATGKRTHVRG